MNALALLSPAAREALEADVRGRCEAEDFDGAATLTIRGYGPEIYGFLVGLHRSDTEADLTMLVLGNLAAGVFHGTPPLEVERIRELIIWIVSGVLTPFVVVPPALLYLRAREAEGNPLISS